MSATVLLDPYSPLDISAQTDSKLEESRVSLVRQDTPQLTLQDYRRWQYSPILSASPELDHRRVRRKPSIQNLTGRSALSAFSWTPSSIPPLSIHSFGPHDHQLHQPSTPRPRAYTASPSLSSTITTLQSTPTHTPIFRGGSFDEQRRRLERSELGEPIGTKRTFSAVKHPRRFPRRQASSEISQDSGPYKVYAAVFDNPGDQGGLRKEPSKAVEQHPTHPASPPGKRDRAVRFTEVDTNVNHSVSSASSSCQSFHRREPTATSSFSLSKFEFPAPPNKDNWAGALDRLPTSPSATVLYRGASFDLINPHASLLLGNHNIETPAEIDGLLDDYFEDHDDTDAMASNFNNGEESQQSLRSASDNTKQTYTLYDDAETARRNILGIPISVTLPAKVIMKEPPTPATAVTMPDFAREAASDVRPSFAPVKRSTTIPFRSRLAAIGRSFGVKGSASNRDLAEEGRSSAFADAHNVGTTANRHDAQRDGSSKELPGFSGAGGDRMSDPFDLSVSEDLNNAELMSLEGVLKQDRTAMLASAPDPSGRRTALTAADVSDTHAISDTEREFAAIYNGYDYTRETNAYSADGPSMSAASIEQGMNAPDYSEESNYGWATPLSPSAEIRSSYMGIRVIDEPDHMRPKPLAPRDSRRDGFVLHRDMPSVHREMRLSGPSDVATSEQTYGETNQLLLITPSTSTPVDSRCNPLTPIVCDAHSRVQEDGKSMNTITQYHDHDDKENTPPGSDYEDDDYLNQFPPALLHEPRIRTGSVVFTPSMVFVNHDSRPSPGQAARIHDPRPYTESYRPTNPHMQHRASSIYPNSEWETDRSESPGLTESVDQDENGDRYSHSSLSVEYEREREHQRRRNEQNLQQRHEDNLQEARLQNGEGQDPFLRRLQQQHEEELEEARIQKGQKSILAKIRTGDAFPNLNLDPSAPRGRWQGNEETYKYLEPGDRRPCYADSGPKDSDDDGYFDPPAPSIADIQRGPYPLVERETGTYLIPKGAPDLSTEPTGDAKRAMDLIEKKASRDHIGVYRLCSPGRGSLTAYKETQELEKLRLRNPDAVREASQRVCHRSTSNIALNASVPKIPETFSPVPSKFQHKVKNPFIRHDDCRPSASKSYQKAAAIGRQELANDSFSSQRGLLSPRAPPDNTLEWSESDGTMVTIRDRKDSVLSPLFPGHVWDPYRQDPTNHALDRLRSTPSTKHTAKTPSNMRSTSSRSGKAAVEGQYEMYRLKLNAKARRNGALTDAEMVKREPHWYRFNQSKQWTMDPNFVTVGEPAHVVEQKSISIKYQTLSLLLPFGPVIFGLGGADWIINRKTGGRITEMTKREKRHALWIYAPLQLLGIVIILLVAVILVVVHSPN